MVFGASRMPSVLDQFPPSANPTSGEGRIFSRYFKRYCAVTTPTPWEDLKTKRAARFFRGGESRICGRVGQKSRFHRHPTRPLGVDDCGRGVGGADSETRCGKCRRHRHRRCLMRHVSHSQGALQGLTRRHSRALLSAIARRPRPAPATGEDPRQPAPPRRP